MNDSICYMAYYMGNKTYLKDTAYRDQAGIYRFQGNDSLDHGMYIFAGQENNKLFDFFVDHNQIMAFSSSLNDLTGQMKVTGSETNRLFFDYVHYLGQKQKEIRPIRERIKRFSNQTDSLAKAKNEAAKLDQAVKNFQKEFLTEHKKSLSVRFLQANQEPTIPSTPILPNGRPDSNFRYHYYKNHYFDNLNLSDAGLLHTPLYQKRVENFLDKMVIQQPDSLIKEIDHLIQLASGHTKTHEFMIWELIIKYERSNIMGLDAVFVHLVEKHIRNHSYEWLNKTVQKNLEERATILTPLLIGKTAPNIVMMDTSGSPRALAGIKADYTLLFFWDTQCSHCKIETPKLIDFYQKNHKDFSFEVFAVCTDTSFLRMKEYIREKDLKWINVHGYQSFTPDFHDQYDIYSTPVFYLLNREKKIIGKRILTDHLMDLIEHDNLIEKQRKSKTPNSNLK